MRTDSVETGIATRDKHLRAGNVLAVGELVTMEFRSTTVLESGDGYDVEGTLRARDISQPVVFHAAPVEQPGPARYTAEMILTPADFGVSHCGTTGPLTVLPDVTLAPRHPRLTATPSCSTRPPQDVLVILATGVTGKIGRVAVQGLGVGMCPGGPWCAARPRRRRSHRPEWRW